MPTKLTCGFAALATVLVLSACNTMTGVGKDIEAGGQKIQQESRDLEHKM